MITTVTLNPCLHRTMMVERFAPGGENAVLFSREDYEGRGVWVSNALARVGQASTIATLRFPASGPGYEQWLMQQGATCRFIDAPGRLRTNLRIQDQITGGQTQCGEAGQMLMPELVSYLYQVIMELASHSEILVIAGGACPGIPDVFYRDVIHGAKGRNPQINVVVDAGGALLHNAIEATPTLINTTVRELESAFRLSLARREDIVAFGQSLTARGVGMVCLNTQGQGAYLMTGGGAFFVPDLGLMVRSAKGAEDAMVAGFCSAMVLGKNVAELLQYGMAFTGAALLQEEFKMGERADIEALLPKILVQQIA